MEPTKDANWFQQGDLLAIVEMVDPNPEAPHWLKRGIYEFRITIGHFTPLQGSINGKNARDLAALLHAVEGHITHRQKAG